MWRRCQKNKRRFEFKIQRNEYRNLSHSESFDFVDEINATYLNFIFILVQFKVLVSSLA